MLKSMFYQKNEVNAAHSVLCRKFIQKFKDFYFFFWCFSKNNTNSFSEEICSKIMNKICFKKNLFEKCLKRKIMNSHLIIIKCKLLLNFFINNLNI